MRSLSKDTRCLCVSLSMEPSETVARGGDAVPVMFEPFHVLLKSALENDGREVEASRLRRYTRPGNVLLAVKIWER